MEATDCVLCDIIHPEPEVCSHGDISAAHAKVIRASWFRCGICARLEANGEAARVCYHLAGSGVDRRKAVSP